MKVTRREFVISSAAGLGTLASSTSLFSLMAGSAGAAISNERLYDYTQSFSLLSRMSFGPTLAQYHDFSEMGLERYLDAQLKPNDAADADCNARLASATLHIEYKASDKPDPAKLDPKKPVPNDYPAVNEDRPLKSLNMSSEELWKLTDGSVRMDGRERNRPVQEVRAATWIRAVYSQWQLREVMVEFWHNHFNVNAPGSWQTSASFPMYDKIMRRNCFGNFRTFLEDIAKSAAMQFYLNNVKSKASPANENYARELFELHTLGADHYYNSLYNRWREVPGATKGHPIGYIDQDVYEAARAFTGWTIADGSNTGRGTIFDKSGDFTYFDGWHDNYQKRVLGNEFDPNSPPLADGKKVLDLVSSHPGTAMFLSTKLCRRFIADEPPPELVRRIAKVWQQSLSKPDQIARVLKAIILSPEYAEMREIKVKRPFEFVVSFLRGTGANVTPNENLFNNVSGAGYRQFEWAAPTGHPDTAEYWLNTNTTLSDWNLLPSLFSGVFKAATFDLPAQTPQSVRTSAEIIHYWHMRLTGRQPDAEVFAGLMQFMPKPNNPAFTPDIHSGGFKEPYQQMVMTIAMLPEFAVRG